MPAGARRCSYCPFNYPPYMTTCPVHGAATSYYVSEDPDELWQFKAEALRQRMVMADAPAENPPRVKVEVTQDEHGQFWISSHDLVRVGLSDRLKADDVLEIPTDDVRSKDEPCDCLWEIQGYRESSRSYWVRPLRVPDKPPRTRKRK